MPLLQRSLFTLAALVALALAVVVVGRWRWNAASAEAVARLLSVAARPAVPAAAVSFDRDLEGLPPPVARYLRQVLRDGQPLVQAARVVWSGRFNMGRPGADDWKDFEATQIFVADPPGFVWDARIAMTPGVPVLVRDALVDGQGSMLGRLAGWMTVVDAARTPQLSQAALQRHLGEALWFPTALLPRQGVRWQAVDEQRARATLASSGLEATADFEFGADGLVKTVQVAERLYDDGRQPPAMRPWQARILDWREVEGIKLPAQAVAEWKLEGGTHAYWRGVPRSVQFEWRKP